MKALRFNLTISVVGVMSGLAAAYLCLTSGESLKGLFFMLCFGANLVFMVMNINKIKDAPAKEDEWIISICNSGGEGVINYRAKATKEAIQRLLYREVLEDRKKMDLDDYDFGTDNVDEIDVLDDGGFYAYSTFTNCHIDYVARKMKEVDYLG